MEFQEEFSQIMKGKRTKRPRQSSPLALTMASTSSSTEEGGGRSGGGVSENSNGGGSSGFDRPVTIASAANSGEFRDRSVDEEEDMANCLILLAQGQTLKTPTGSPLVLTTSYQCKTCDRCFPSFQALGGHRASHNKPNKAGANEEEKKKKKPLMKEDNHQQQQQHQRSTTTDLSLRIPNSRVSPNNKPRVHECSICAAEFSTGQALGGHMRRHRTAVSVSTSSGGDDETKELKKSRQVLALDLNLPAAPEEDEHSHESKFVFSSKKQVIVFSASSLVDCHY